MLACIYLHTFLEGKQLWPFMSDMPVNINQRCSSQRVTKVQACALTKPSLALSTSFGEWMTHLGGAVILSGSGSIVSFFVLEFDFRKQKTIVNNDQGPLWAYDRSIQLDGYNYVWRCVGHNVIATAHVPKWKGNYIPILIPQKRK